MLGRCCDARERHHVAELNQGLRGQLIAGVRTAVAGRIWAGFGGPHVCGGDDAVEAHGDGVVDHNAGGTCTRE